MRHAAVVVTLGSAGNDQDINTEMKVKEGTDKTDSKDASKDTLSATHKIVPLEDEVR